MPASAGLTERFDDREGQNSPLRPELEGSKRRAMSDRTSSSDAERFEAACGYCSIRRLNRSRYRSLAERVVAKGTLYLYFSTKEALFLEGSSSSLRCGSTRWRKRCAKRGPLDRARAGGPYLYDDFCSAGDAAAAYRAPYGAGRNITLEQALSLSGFVFDRPSLRSGAHRSKCRRSLPD